MSTVLIAILFMFIGFFLAIIIAGIVMLVLKKKRKRLPAQASTPDITTGIRLHAYEFNGLYEPLFRSMMSTEAVSDEAYFAWCDRVELTADADFQVLFRAEFSRTPSGDDASARARITRLVRCIFDSGITRHGKVGAKVTVGSNNSQLFLDASGNKPKIGTEGTVTRAAWCLGSSVVEPGTII